MSNSRLNAIHELYLEICSIFRRIKERISVIYHWLPIIITDHDWDYGFIYNALQHKLKRTADYIESKKRHENWEEDVKYLRICVKLIDLLTQRIYECEYRNYVEEKFKHVACPAGVCYTIDSEIIWEKFDEYINQNKLTYKKVLNRIKENREQDSNPDEKRWHCHLISSFKHEKARKLLFNILTEKIEDAWD